MLNRNLFLNGEINTASVQNIVQNILTINEEDEHLEKQYTEVTRTPIKLFINSTGGNVYDGFALIDVIRHSTTPIHTIVVGSAMSMGMLIYAVGHKRYVGEYATLMFHDVSSAIVDKLEGMKDRMEELRKIQAMICTIVTNNSNIPLNTLAAKLNQREDWYISADEAIQYQLADGFLNKI